MTAQGAIVGLGMTEFGKVYGKSATELAADAVGSAAADAGISLADVDGLLVNAGAMKSVSLTLQQHLGLRDLPFGAEVQSFGSSAGVMVQLAMAAVAEGRAKYVACVFADDPLKQGGSAGATYAGKKPVTAGVDGLSQAVGLRGAPTAYALPTRRHMSTYGTTSEDLGAVAVSTRAWATMNPQAQMRTPITLEDHQAARMIADPLRLLDCCLVSNGAIAVIVTSVERAADLPAPAAYVHGYGQSHVGYPMDSRSTAGLVTGAKKSGEQAFGMAGITVDDITVAEIYDCFTFTTLVTMEDYGFYEKGAGGDFFRSGVTAPGGSLPVNTGGGQLSGYYMWGMTPLSEAVIQARGRGGERQVERNDLILVSGNGGALEYHSTLILSPNR